MANYPSSVSTNANLYIAVNGLQTTLASPITNSVTTIPLTSTSGFPTTGYVTIENNEVVSYTGISGANLTGCTRGADGTTALAHSTGVTVGATIVAAHHNLLKDEVIAIETALGANLVNVFPATPTTGTGNVVLQTSPTINSPTLTTPALGTPASGVLTNATGLPLTTGVTGVLPNANTTATPNATASTIMSRDANVNVKINNIVENFSTTVTAAGTTALTVTSSPTQQFTGTTTQTVTLPDATTLSVGHQFTVLNRSTGAVAVNNNGGSLQKSVPTSTQYIFTVTNIGSANGTWDVSSDAGTGTVTSVSGTTNQITSTGGSAPVLAIANPVTLPGAMTAGGNIAMASFKLTGLVDGTAAQDSASVQQARTLARGRIISQASSTSSTSTAVTSSTYQAVGPQQTVTLTNSSNWFRITLTGQIQNNNASNTAALLTLARDGTNILPTAGFAALAGVVTVANTTCATIVFWDAPGDLSSHTYRGYLKSTDNSTIVRFSEQGNAQILVEEISALV